MEIRQASYSDIPEMARMIGELFSIELDFPVDAERQRRALHALLDCETAAVFVATDEARDAVIGMVTIQLTISTAQGGPSGLLEDMFVGKEHRGRGVATALLETVEKWCLSRGAGRVQLFVDLTNKGALQFYDARGYAETRMAARRRIIEDGELPE